MGCGLNHLFKKGKGPATARVSKPLQDSTVEKKKHAQPYVTIMVLDILISVSNSITWEIVEWLEWKGLLENWEIIFSMEERQSLF